MAKPSVKLLAKIDTVFEIRGRGVVIVPVWLSDLKVRVGTTIQLRSANGNIKDTEIAAIEFLKSKGQGGRIAFMLRKDVQREEIAEGMEIWLNEGNGAISAGDSRLGTHD